MGLEAHLVAHPCDVVERSDILCTLTPSVDPLVHAADVPPGLHVNAVGSPPRPNYRELATDVLAAARVVVDSAPVAAAESGTIQAAFDDGSINRHEPLTELGDVLRGHTRGRADDRQVTVFVSVGLGIQDLAAVTLLLDTASQRGGGRDITDSL
jgi:ornithine cyclodeaminase/alanine dehydrogenase